MLSFFADENFNYRIVRGVLRLNPAVDILRVQDVGLGQADDPVVLEWAAQQRRVVLSHDVNTMRRFAFDRVEQGLPMPGLFLVKDRSASQIAAVIEDILIVAECSLEGEWEGREVYLPLRS